MTKTEFRALLAEGAVLLDGATGSNLMKAGMPRGVCAEQWISEHPRSLLALQEAYVAAGSRILYAPTFGANRFNLARHGLQKKTAELNKRLLSLSRQAAQGKAFVAGDMTTTGVPLAPAGDLQESELFEIYAEQARALQEADLLVVETMLGLDECMVALEAAQSVCELPVVCSVSVQADGSCYFNSDCREVVEVLQGMGADAVGINCSCGPEQLVSLVRNMKGVAEVPLLVKPNAGMPRISESGEAVYPMQPEDFARHMAVLIAEGAQLVGGCCGTDPAFIQALNAIL